MLYTLTENLNLELILKLTIQNLEKLKLLDLQDHERFLTKILSRSNQEFIPGKLKLNILFQ